MTILNEMLRPFLGKVVVVYLDDILFYNRNKKIHLQNLKKVFVALLKKKLFVKNVQMLIFKESLIFLEHVGNKNGRAMDHHEI